MTENLTLPQFKIIGHLQKEKQVALSTGERPLCVFARVRLT